MADVERDCRKLADELNLELRFHHCASFRSDVWPLAATADLLLIADVILPDQRRRRDFPHML